MEAIYDDYAKVNFANYQLRREDLDQLAAFARQFKDVHEFLSQLALISNVDAEAAPVQTNEKEAVNLSSVHQAKGLEFHTVFVIWLTDGMFPSSRSLDTRDALEEERRLFYVAITRARDELYLTYPHMRLSGGYGDVFQRPSRFLQEIPNDLVEDWQVTERRNDETRRMSNDEDRDERSRRIGRTILWILRLRFVRQDDNLLFGFRHSFGIRHSSFVILFMNLSPEKKIAGVLVPLFALRGENDLGIGDLGALREFIDWIAEIGFTLVQLLPINETGADNSPYNAISAMAIEPTTLHLAPGSPEDLTRDDFADALSEIDLASLRRGRVKYRRVKELKQRILEKAFANFSARADEKRRV